MKLANETKGNESVMLINFIYPFSRKCFLPYNTRIIMTMVRFRAAFHYYGNDPVMLTLVV